MLDVVRDHNVIAPMSDGEVAKVRDLEALAMQLPQQVISTSHLFHAGLYARTIMVPAGVMITGALIKIATMLIISGDVVMYVAGQARELHGYNVFSASAHRKQAFVALTDTYLTMVFPTNALTVEDAEREFTSEADLLLSRHTFGSNLINVTGE